MAKESEWAEMRISGLLGWVHKIVMLITFPFRKFWQIVFFIIFLLLILISVPMYKGVAFRDIWAWYQDRLPARQIADMKDKAQAEVNAKITSVKKKISGIVPDSVQKSEPEQKKKEEVRFVAWNVAEFGKAKYKPQPVKPASVAKVHNEQSYTQLKETAQESKAEEQESYAEAETDKVDTEIMPDVGNLTSYYRVLKNRDLAYISEPEVLYDTIKIVDPNAIYINNTYMYLYGIYSNPQYYNVADAEAYLQSLTEGHKVRCDIVAYTVQTQAATALCFVGDIFINKAMVDNGFADNIALK